MKNPISAYDQWEAKIAEIEKSVWMRGWQRGLKIGEMNRSLEIARRMLVKNFPIAEIMELTDLTIEQIQELQERS